MMGGKRRCPKCEAWMIRFETGIATLTWPILHEQLWYCGCGYREQALPRESTTRGSSEGIRDHWRVVNGMAPLRGPCAVGDRIYMDTMLPPAGIVIPLPERSKQDG